MTRKRVGVLISGRGSNLQALVDAAQAPDYPAEILLVISNVPGAQGLARADEAGIAALAINHKDFASREDFDTVLNETLKQTQESAQKSQVQAQERVKVIDTILPRLKAINQAIGSAA